MIFSKVNDLLQSGSCLHHPPASASSGAKCSRDPAGSELPFGRELGCIREAPSPLGAL